MAVEIRLLYGPAVRHERNLKRIEPLLGELTRFARWLAATPDDGDDVVQETLLRVLKATYTPEDERARRAWLFRTARNAHVDLRRHRAARDRFVLFEGGLDDLPDDEATSGPVPGAIEVLDLEAALMQLPEGARAAVVLADVWAFDHEEIARILDIPLGTVKSRVVRARARLAALLTDAAPAARRGP